MKYEMLWISSKDKQAYSNYARNKIELREKLDYFINEKGLKVNDTDRFDNIQVSKRIGKKYLILSKHELLNEIDDLTETKVLKEDLKKYINENVQYIGPKEEGHYELIHLDFDSFIEDLLFKL